MTTQQPIKIGLIGANIHVGWSPRAHLPALAAHPDFDLAAVCTTRQESADEAQGRLQRRQRVGRLQPDAGRRRH